MLAEFGDVGLMTGDVTINPSATCLIMTTEVNNETHQFYRLKKTNPTLFPKDFAVYAVSRIRDHA